MPSGIYQHKKGKEHYMFGRKLSETTKKKISIGGKGKGMLGKKHSEETKRKIGIKSIGRKSFLGKHHSEETKQKIGKVQFGRKHSKEFIEKQRNFMTGNKYALGKHWKLTEEQKRKWSDIRKGKSIGKDSPNWRGGKSFEIYPEKFWELRLAIRARDNYICQLCRKYPAFDCHHIDYNKQNCEPENLITLCRSCHLKTNFNRDYWINYFKNYASTPRP